MMHVDNLIRFHTRVQSLLVRKLSTNISADMYKVVLKETQPLINSFSLLQVIHYGLSHTYIQISIQMNIYNTCPYRLKASSPS